MTDMDPGGFADIHSHLVPGVDDGAHNLDDTLEAVGRMTKLGIRKILTTPHLNGSFTRNGEEIEARLSEVDEAFDRVQPRRRRERTQERLGPAIGRNFVA